MKKKINCFIPFGNPKDTIQTVKELQASELVNKIYLLSADTNKECLPGCECLLINGLYSTSTIKTICFLPSSFTVCQLSFALHETDPAKTRIVRTGTHDTDYTELLRKCNGIRRSLPTG